MLPEYLNQRSNSKRYNNHNENAYSYTKLQTQSIKTLENCIKMLLCFQETSIYNQTLLYSIQKMKALKKTDLMIDFPHLQMQWQPLLIENNLCYQHTHSLDLSQIRHVKSINMCELNLYASREAYCFPYCPRIYKYLIHQNDCNRRQINFNLQVLTEKAPRRLSASFALSATQKELNMLSNKVIDIVKGFEYLFKRFGAFHIIPQMIGWTNIDVIKVWFNQDFASNNIMRPILDPVIMIQDLINILEECRIILNNHASNQIKSFKQLIQHLSYSLKNKSHTTCNQCELTQPLDIQLNLMLEPSLNKKNVNFSYSTKNIAGNPLFFSRYPKNNSVIARNQNETLEPQSNHQAKQLYSLKIIQNSVQRKTKKRVSAFKPYNLNNNIIPLQQVTNLTNDYLQTLPFSDRYSTTIPTKNILQQTLAEGQWQKCKRQLLNFSTSSNSQKKLINMIINDDKTSRMSAYECNKINNSDDAQPQINQSMKRIHQVDAEVQISQKAKQIAMFQQLNTDLQALFDREQEISFSELEDQLSKVL